MQTIIVNMEFACPLRNCLDTSVEFIQSFHASIQTLFASRSPMAVFRTVGSIIVNAINRVIARWSWPHIFIEISETIPALADRDASSSVALVSMGFRIETAFPNAAPDDVFGTCVVLARLSMRQGRRMIETPAATRSALAFQQVISQHVAFLATHARAWIFRHAFRGDKRRAKHAPAPKTFAWQNVSMFLNPRHLMHNIPQVQN